MILWMGPWTQKICRASTWLLALAIVVLSLVPLSYACASHDVAHLAIFLATGFGFGVAHPHRPFTLAVKTKIIRGTGHRL